MAYTLSFCSETAEVSTQSLAEITRYYVSSASNQLPAIVTVGTVGSARTQIFSANLVYHQACCNGVQDGEPSYENEKIDLIFLLLVHIPLY